jgi:hypothetical protein
MAPKPTYHRPPSEKKIRKRSVITKLSGKFLRLRKWKIYARNLWYLTTITASVRVLWFIFIGSSRRDTTHITRDQATLETLRLPLLYETLQQKILGKHYILCQITCGRMLSFALRKDYPFLRRVTIKSDGRQRFIVWVEYYPPRLVFRQWTRKRWTFQEYMLPISPQESWWNDQKEVLLPDYLDGIKHLTWIFYQIPEDSLATRIQIIRDTLPAETVSSITYIPWWEKVLITYKNKSVYIHLLKDIDLQLAKLIDLEQWYKEFQTVTMIDLGSSEYVIVR